MKVSDEMKAFLIGHQDAIKGKAYQYLYDTLVIAYKNGIRLDIDELSLVLLDAHILDKDIADIANRARKELIAIVETSLAEYCENIKRYIGSPADAERFLLDLYSLHYPYELFDYQVEAAKQYFDDYIRK